MVGTSVVLYCTVRPAAPGQKATGQKANHHCHSSAMNYLHHQYYRTNTASLLYNDTETSTNVSMSTYTSLV